MPKGSTAQAATKLDTTAIENDIEAIQVRLQVLENILDLQSEKANDSQTASLYDLVSNEIGEARSSLLDVSEAVQLLKFAPSPVATERK